MPNLTVGGAQAVLSADTHKFDSALAGVEQQLGVVGRAAELAGEKVEASGEMTAQAAAQMERAKERMARAWNRELLVQEKAIAKENEMSRARQAAALHADIEARSVEMLAKAKEHEAAIRKVSEELIGVGEFAGPMLAAGAALAVVDGFKEMISKTMETGVELGHLHQQTGISVQDLSVLKYAAAATGVEFETLQKGFKKLSTEAFGASQGSAQAAKAFDDLGVSEADLKAKGDDLFGVLTLVSDRFAAMPDGIKKNALATELFGKAGQQLIPILNQGSEALAAYRAQAPIFSDKDVERMEQMHEATERLNASWGKFELNLVTLVSPALTKVLDWLSRIRVSALSSPIVVDETPEAAVAKPSFMQANKWMAAHNTRPGGNGAGGAADPSAYWASISGGGPNTYWIQQMAKRYFADFNEAMAANAETARVAGDRAWREFVGGNAVDFASIFKSASPDVQSPYENDDARLPFQGLRDNMLDTMKVFTDLDSATTRLIDQGINSLNSEMAKAMTGQRTNFSGVFRSLAESAARMGLQGVEGGIAAHVPALMKWLNQGKQVGTMNVQAGMVNVGGGASAGLSGMPGGGGAGVAGKGGNFWSSALRTIGGLLGIFKPGGGDGGDMGSGSVTSDFSLDSYQIPMQSMDMLSMPGRASGGPVLAGVPYMVGERGPEPFIPSTSGTIIPNHAMGGGGSYYEIHAEGADAAAINQRVGRALEKVHGSAIRNAVAVATERRRRTPSSYR